MDNLSLGYDEPLPGDVLRLGDHLKTVLRSPSTLATLNESILDMAVENLARQKKIEMKPTDSFSLEIRRLLRDGFAVHDPLHSTLRKALQDVVKEMVDIKSKLIVLSRSTREYHGLFAPVRRLSDDVLGQILTMVVSEDNRLPNGATRTLTSVCARWRRVAFSTPAFWATIAITPSFQRSRDLDVLKRHLSHSQMSALTYYLNFVIDQQLIPVLFDEHSHRAQDLQLPLTESGVSTSFELMREIFTRYGNTGKLPNLRGFHIRHPLGGSMKQFYYGY
ncbi:hypothetical protein AAF712_011816 [Marasmius tenuissimus]|uniref:F-box domain-containing protein n=1 Tax=Marasmius tenuissimus TaxID=585030 RepID=A0ABR2ZJ05_9AGAR